MAERLAISAAELEDASWADLSGAVRRLEHCWQAAGGAELAEFLPAAESYPFRIRILIELIKVDQEYRWKSRERKRLEGYLHDWPELSDEADVVRELLAAECLTRAEFDTVPTEGELASRFPQIVNQIDLEAIEREAGKERMQNRPDVASLANAQTPNGASAQSPARVGGVWPLVVGQHFGRYEIRGLLGEGGMGTVYRAYDTQLKREIALKIPRFDPNIDFVIRKRFIDEAQAAAAIRHPNICPIHDVGEIDGVCYITMSLIEGQSLAARLANGPIDPRRAADLVRRISGALDTVHHRGIVHRDIKPSNVIIEATGEPLLMDFGLARHTETDLPGTESGRGAVPFPPQSGHVIPRGSLSGTPAYMSPEQVRGDAEAIGPATDIYSLGVILYELLTGEPPFRDSRAEVLAQIMAVEPRPPSQIRPGLDPRLEAICLKAMAKRVEDRFASAAGLAAALEDYLRSAPWPERLRRALHGVATVLRRVPRWAYVVAGCGAAALVLGAVFFLQTNYGAVTIELADPVPPTVQVMVNDNTIDVPDLGEPIRLRPGKHHLEVTAAGYVGHSESFAVRRGELEVLRVSLSETPQPPPASAEPQILFQEKFAGPGPGLPPGWSTPKGIWAVRDGALAVEIPTPWWPAVAFAPRARWKDYAVECEFRHDQGVAGVLFRRTAEDRFYGFMIELEKSANRGIFPSVQFGEFFPQFDANPAKGNGYAHEPLARKDYALTRRQFHKLRVQTVGNRMSAYIDGMLVLEAEDRQQVLGDGGIGLLAHDSLFKPGIAFFRNLRVEKIGDWKEDKPVVRALPTRVIAAWEFNEGQGTTVRDGSGNGNDGTLEGGFQWVDGREGKAVRLDGKTGFIRVPHRPSQNGIRQLTIHVRFKLHSCPKGRAAIVKKWGVRSRAENAFLLNVDATPELVLQLDVDAGLDHYVARWKDIPLEKWVEAAAVYDGIRETLYARVENGPWEAHEGFEIPRELQGSAIRDTQEPIEIGCHEQHEDFLHITLDSLRIIAGIDEDLIPGGIR